MALVAVAAACLVGCDAAPTPSTDSDRLATFDQDGLSFAYPSSWRPYHHDVVSSFSSSIGDLATVPVPDPCVRTQTDSGTEIACSDRFRLIPDSLVVHITAGGFPGWDVTHLPPNARALQVGGRRAFVEEGVPPDLAVGADVVVTWSIERPEAEWNFYVIQALIRGPAVDAIRAQLAHLIDTVRFAAP